MITSAQNLVKSGLTQNTKKVAVIGELLREWNLWPRHGDYQ
ncbi:hypothetical protein PN473_17835 [Dolichospermum circinale CS-545/17]|nr:hypothetical protein [Dolichospermum circinale]MDB9460250.1 hypothetical protein [Dolichospermum circinale CS-545/17]MDB9467925.1 hypothetical protein [Dolichospermum circinale CS-539/09]